MSSLFEASEGWNILQTAQPLKAPLCSFSSHFKIFIINLCDMMYDIHIISSGGLTVSVTVCLLLDWTQDVVISSFLSAFT